ncbi:chemotaxis protein [Sulfitobacter sp. SK012]|uniref:CheR family methyltransferase n=1 Tax=Sulfitobacter sp. SK012 TaxID=1389005 RepID=UPI000E0AE0B2|nr:protein-glutamate O-methyltransferase [Sulfitobacter sp. SK012]AXI46717.1 chemotaxis protein [Sulfitobacter sp. SK012]
MQDETNILDEQSFEFIVALAYRESGLTLAPEKKRMVQSRLQHRLQALSLPDFGSYSALLQSDRGVSERRKFISALTTNVSHFFREPHHFDLLSGEIISLYLPILRAGGRMRIWSAGCANGQEALSIAMSMLNRAPELSELDVRILATDIDPEVIAFAQNGFYPERMLNGVPKPMLDRYFTPISDDSALGFSASSWLKSMISYKELNLLGSWPMRGSFDVIFCRNVVIYFDGPTQLRLWHRFHNLLSPDGILLIGHSERIAGPEEFGFRAKSATCYERSQK